MTFGMTVVAGVLLASLALARGESKDSPAALTNAEAQAQLKLDQFAKTNANYQLLLDAEKISASLTATWGATNLGKLDEERFRLKLKVLLALAAARDPHYDPGAPTNRAFINLIPPLPDSNGVWWPSGVDPNAIKDPQARKAYEQAIAENNRRIEKANRERALELGEEYAIVDIWIFIRNFPQDSAALKSAWGIIYKDVFDQTILDKLRSDSAPGWP